MIKLTTSLGTIAIELDAEKAPKSAQNFIDYVNAGHYDNTVFHRVISGFMIQGGGFEPGMKQKPVREPIENEAGNGLKNKRGSVAETAAANNTRHARLYAGHPRLFSWVAGKKGVDGRA